MLDGPCRRCLVSPNTRSFVRSFPTKFAVELALASYDTRRWWQSPRGACMPMRTRSMPVALLDEDGATRPAPRLSGNTKSLLMMFVLFTSITAAQWVGGVLAHSLALKVGC